MVDAVNPYAAPAAGSLEPSIGNRGDISFAPYTAAGMRKLYWWGMGLSATLVFMGVGFILLLILQYRAWKMIQSIKPRTTPGKAVGFQFIPFFNIYWNFVVSIGLAEGLNSFNQQSGLTSRRVSIGLAKALPIMILVQIIPILGYFVLVAWIVCLLIYMHQVAYTAADMIDATTKPA